MAKITIMDYKNGAVALVPVKQLVKDKKEGFVKEYWRPAMAVLYLMLCFLDYAIRPIINEMSAKNFNLAETVETIQNLQPSVQVQALQIASSHEKWPPILSEFVHIAFGAILTGAAVTRGMEKTARTKYNGYGYESEFNYGGGRSSGFRRPPNGRRDNIDDPDDVDGSEDVDNPDDLDDIEGLNDNVDKEPPKEVKKGNKK